METPEEFDYIVIGAGSAGCVVAARLSESGIHSVALVEAGGEDKSFWIHAPLGFGMLFNDPNYNWLYESEPEAELKDAKSFQPRGKVLGGTGSINGMLYMRGQREDFDVWRQLGNVGWSYDDVLPYFRKAEDNERGANEYHGTGGPLRVSNIRPHELGDAFIAAGLQAGYSRNDDFNGATQEGFGYNQVMIRDGRRCSTAAGYLHPIRNRRNLRVIVKALTTRILFRGDKAVGVEIKRDGVIRNILARREIVLCAGVFNTPQLLQVSGIGPGEKLRQLGIPVIKDLSGVGMNLQDHFTVGATYRCSKPITINDVVNNPFRRYAMGFRYLMRHDGYMATNASVGGGCIRTDPSQTSPVAKLQLWLWGRSATGRSKERMGLYPFSSFNITMNLIHPESRGSVWIKDRDPAVQPNIHFNFFVSEKDRRNSAAALGIMRQVMSMPAVARYVAEELEPGPKFSGESDLVEYCRRNGRSSYHAVGTCQMGTGDDAVVDARLRIHGLRGLRVIDASIMPRIVGGNTVAAIIMIGEKGSAMILEDAVAA